MNRKAKKAKAHKPAEQNEYTYKASLDCRADLTRFGDNRLLLYALELKYGIEDIVSDASRCLTDGSGDCKCDLVYVDLDQGVVVVAQAYVSRKERKEASSNKAADLNAACAWLLSDLTKVPPTIKSAAQEVQDALRSGKVKNFNLWYVHNLPGSSNCDDQMRTAADAVSHQIQSRFPQSSEVDVSGLEVSQDVIEEWYRASTRPIQVSDKIEIASLGAFEIHGDNWDAVVGCIQATELKALWDKYASKLFSANVREYLGHRNSTQNVNFGIMDTITKYPDRFWAYNNGVTAIVHDYELRVNGDRTAVIAITGLSIVNGAQTTGAIGQVATIPATASVPIRIIKCNDTATVRDIIRYNNTQNVIRAADFRSNDPVQQRLRQEFSEVPGAVYLGGRRGSAEGERRENVPSGSCAQALAAFHGRPGVAYNKKSEIWEKDEEYSRIFSEATTAQHIVLVFSLLRSIENRKLALLKKSGDGTSGEEEQLTFFSRDPRIGVDTVMRSFLRDVGAGGSGRRSPDIAVRDC